MKGWKTVFIDSDESDLNKSILKVIDEYSQFKKGDVIIIGNIAYSYMSSAYAIELKSVQHFLFIEGADDEIDDDWT